MLWTKFIAALAIVPGVVAKPLFMLKATEVEKTIHKISTRGGPAPKNSNPAGQDKYTVISGDTGNTIAAVYSITFNTLSAANPNVNWNALAVGQVLNMPSSRRPVQYTTQNGDSQGSIAQKYNCFSNDLGNANPSANFAQAGSAIRVPQYGRATTYVVYSGDTGYAIAQAFGIPFQQLSDANPGVNWDNLSVGQTLNVPAGVSPTTGTLPTSSTTTVASTTTTRSSTTSTVTTTSTTTTTVTTTRTTSTSTATTTSTSSRSTTTSSTTTTSSSTTATTSTSTSTTSRSTTSSTTTSSSLSTTTSSTTTSSRSSTTTTTTSTPVTSTTTTTTTSTTTSRPPTTTTTTTTSTTTSRPPTTTTTTTTTITTTTTTSRATTTTTSSSTTTTTRPATASVTGPLAVKSVNNNDGNANSPDTYTFYSGDGSTGQGWPDASKWASYNLMWNRVKPFIGKQCYNLWKVPNNSDTENSYINAYIQQVAYNTGVDHRLILATIIQESSGCVRVPTTFNGETNPGLMQDYNGNSTCNGPNGVLDPCPPAQILGMITDGTMGTTTKTSEFTGGLVQRINSQSGYPLAQAYYRSSRLYNAGSIPSSDLGAPGATRCYVSDIANRLMGWVTAASTCTLR